MARTALHLVSGLVQVAIQSPAKRRRELLDETKVALHAYLGVQIAKGRRVPIEGIEQRADASSVGAVGSRTRPGTNSGSATSISSRKTIK